MPPTDQADPTPLVQGSEHGAPRPLAVFGVAILIRLIVASVFLGGPDGINAITRMGPAIEHHFLSIPYFPLIPNWLALAGGLDGLWHNAARVSHLGLNDIPSGIFPKLLPCIADSLVATWFALDASHSSRFRQISSWAYIACPLPLLLACIQGQWDSAWILFSLCAIAITTQADVTVSDRRVAGALLALGVLFKPVPLVLLPLLFPRFRDRSSLSNWLRGIRPVLVGLFAVIAVSFSWFAFERIDLARNVRFVLRYSTTDSANVPIGLSHLAALNHFGDPTGLLRNLAIVLAVAVLVHHHVTHTPTRPMATAAVVLLILPAVGGIAPQYFLWALPFMLAAGFFRVAVAYSAVSVFAVLAYYLVGGVTSFFVPIRSLRFLAVPTAATNWLSSPGPTAVWRPISSFAIPLLMLTTAVLLLRLRSDDQPRVTVGGHVMARRAVTLNVGIVVIFAVAAIVYRFGPFPGVAERLRGLLQLHGYARLPEGWWLSALWLIPILSLVWAAISWRCGCSLSSTTAEQSH